MAVFFNGRLYITPANASMVDDSGMFNRNLSVGNRVAIVGKAEGGKPFTALRFGTPDQARSVLGSNSEAMKAVEKAFDPSSETGGPAEVIFVRVDPATQAALTLLDMNGMPSIALVSTDYGVRNNQIKAKVESGSISGKKLTSQFGDSYFSADNVGRQVLSVQYMGAEVSASLSITGLSIALNINGTISNIDLPSYPTVQQLADRLNAIAGVSAIVLDGNGEHQTVNALDFVSNVDVKAATGVFRADLQACIDWLNGNSEGYVNAARPDGAGLAPANIGFSYLAGAVNGTVTNAEWQAAYDAMQKVDVQWITPLSSSPSIHAMNDTHGSFMSNVGQRERRSICGTPLGTTDDAAVAAAKALNSDRTSLMHLGIYDYDAAGNLKLYPPYVAAAMCAGMFAGVNPGTALTNKSVKIRGLERVLRVPTDTDVLLTGGVMCIEETDEGFKVVQSISTWLNNKNYNRREQSVGVACDFTVRNVRDAVAPCKGKKGTPLLMGEIRSRVSSALDKLAKPEPMGPGVLVGDENNPAWRKLVVSLEGDVIRYEYEASPVIPANYILQVAHMVPYSGSV